MLGRLFWTKAAAVACVLWAKVGVAQVAMPFYSAEHALAGVYAHHLPPLSKAFRMQADALVQATDAYCEALLHKPEPISIPVQQSAWLTLHTQWRQTMVSWEALSAPALGPVLMRRSQREIDFWPTRPALIAKALERSVQTLKDMEQVGTLAKGLPAFEALLALHYPQGAVQTRAIGARGAVVEELKRQGPFGNAPMSPATCHYLALVAQGVQAESHALGDALLQVAAKNWLEQSEVDAEVTRAALVEWLNQWLGGVERLRWMHVKTAA